MAYTNLSKKCETIGDKQVLEMFLSFWEVWTLHQIPPNPPLGKGGIASSFVWGNLRALYETCLLYLDEGKF